MQARRYIVYRGGEKIAEISDQPGPLISAKAPPPAPDAKPALHPFLSATAYVPEEEGRLARRAQSIAQFAGVSPGAARDGLQRGGSAMKSGFVLQPKMPTAKPEPSFTRPSARMLQRKCACGGTVVAGGECAECRNKRLQTKLAVNQPGDRLEHEADRMADFVIRGGKQAPVLSDWLVRRVAARPTEHVVCVRQCTADRRTRCSRDQGQPLDSSTRAFMEPRFGHDFGNVRVHFDARAAASSPLGQRARLHGGARHCLQRRRVCAR